MRVLLADDHQILRDGIRRGLESAGEDVVGEADNGEEAVALAIETRPDIVLMDLSMPVLDGVSTVDQLALKSGRTKIILMTGDPTSLKSAYDRRPEVFTIIEKPIPLRVLRRFVIDALGLTG